MVAIGVRARIEIDRLGAFIGVASNTGVEEIVVVALSIRVHGRWNKMLDAKVRPRVGFPAFAAEAENTTERELVPQPRLELLIMEVTARAVSTLVGTHGVIEDHQEDS